MSVSKSTYATGRRKSAVAQVTMTLGRGDFTINTQPAAEYLRNDAFFKPKFVLKNTVKMKILQLLLDTIIFHLNKKSANILHFSSI